MPLADLVDAARLIEDGKSLPEALRVALELNSTVDGARPKALIVDSRRPMIAKFPSATDVNPAVGWEALGMDLARRVGIDVAETSLIRAAGRDVLLVRRFKRDDDGSRRMQVSAGTILGVNPELSLRELFRRTVLNVAFRNTDDHARNTAAFWDGRRFTLTPAASR